MSRPAAFRASMFFMLATLLFISLGISSATMLAEALALIAGSLCAITLVFSLVTPRRAPVPVRVRARRRI